MIEVQTGEFLNALRRFDREVLGADFAKFTRSEAKGLLRQVIRHTPPDTQKQGQDAVERSVKQAVRPLEESAWRSERIRKMIRERRDSQLEATLRSMPNQPRWIKGMAVIPFSAQAHTRQRDRRGRVQRQRPFGTTQTDIQAQYIADLKRRVGWALAGWNQSAKALKVTVSGKSFSKRLGSGGGSHSEIISEQSGRLTIAMENRNIKQPGFERKVADAMRIRAKNINKNIDRILRGGAHKYGIGTGPAVKPTVTQ